MLNIYLGDIVKGKWIENETKSSEKKNKVKRDNSIKKEKMVTAMIKEEKKKDENYVLKKKLIEILNMTITL